MEKLVFFFIIFLLSFQVYSQNSTHLFSINSGAGIDNNKEFMLPIDLGYKFKYKFTGVGANIDFWIMSKTINHSDLEKHGNNFAFNLDLLTFIADNNFSLNFGYSPYFISQHITNATYVGAEKGSGDSLKFFSGLTFQLQYFAKKSTKIGFNILIETRLISTLSLMYAIKAGIYF